MYQGKNELQISATAQRVTYENGREGWSRWTEEFKSHYSVYATDHPNNCIYLMFKTSEMNENYSRNENQHKRMAFKS